MNFDLFFGWYQNTAQFRNMSFCLINPKLLSLHTAGRAAATGVKGAAAVANTVGAQYSVYSTLNEDPYGLDTDGRAPTVGIGLKWNFGR